ncbi:MAG: tetratricopeptide repeat protein [Chloroflexota bacterium]|nr:tetratricopeptide repeat protein [Chloroflexota bacterium]
MASTPAPGERDSAYDLFQRGSELLAADHPAAAAVLLERADRIEPGKASIVEALARAYYNNGDPTQAAERFRTIVERNPLDHYGHFGLGLSYKRLGRSADARRHLRMAVFLKPESENYRRALQRLGTAA